MSRIILFGGTFDPIHNGHIALCQAALDFADADRVILIPTIPPYKQNAKIASGEDRLFMCQLATRGMEHFAVDASEIERGTPAYTADTIQRLARKYPEDDLYYLLGSDAFMAFHYWVRWKEVAENAILLVGLRGDENREEMLYERDRLTKEGVRVILMENSPVVISATEIRKKIRSKETLKYLHPDVAKYIQLRDLYYDSQEDDESNLDAITDKVRRAPVHAHEHAQHAHEHTNAHEHAHTHSHADGGHESESNSKSSSGHPQEDHCGHLHSEEEKKAVINRLSRAIGHLEHVKMMVERGDDCSDVLIQLAAVRSAINNTGKVVLHNHINECIVDAVEHGDMETVNRMEEAIKFFIK